MNNIIPSSDLRNRYPEISRMCHETGQPVIITVNGRGDTVLLSYEAYQKFEMDFKLLIAYSKGINDFKNGKVGDYDKLMEELRKELKIK